MGEGIWKAARTAVPASAEHVSKTQSVQAKAPLCPTLTQPP